MAETIETKCITPFRRLIAERLEGTELSLARSILAVALALERWHATSPLQYADEPPRRIELTEAGIAAYLAHVERARAEGIAQVFRLMNSGDRPQVALFFDVEPTPYGNIEYIWSSLPTTNGERIIQLRIIIELVATVSKIFGAYNCHIEDESLLLLYRGARAAERARAIGPPELRQFVPEPSTPARSAGRLPRLLVPQEFNRRYVPDAVWWVNFWDHIQIETVGRNLVTTASWAQIVEQPDGALILVATRDPSNAENESHTRQLRQLTNQLKLRKLQERYRHQEDNS